MALRIKDSSMFEARSLTLQSNMVVFQQTSLFGGKRQFAFQEIDYVLMAPDHMLSFQVGKEVFSIRTRPDKRKHKDVIGTLLRCIRQSQLS